ncbi:uncharacterized protein LOC118464531 [Anopheles albimanus]|uniref:uncharacterized protein LOC118464531 n=1 Tax=Anopheles albimanus TaxID=7167 RepID=UPI0016402461|nr:uncharacterized protein LOC118464531 [Anopheles albimanus]
MVFILLFTIDTYDETVSVNPDTAYLHWNSTFPAVSICYAKGSPKHISSFLKQHWADSNVTPSKSTSYLWPKVAQTYLFVSPNVNMDEDNAIVCTGLNSTCNLNLEVMRSMFFPTDCQDVLFDVRYRGAEYNCSQIFHYSITEMGSCFTANSIYDHDLQFDMLPLKYNFWTRRRSLEFSYKNYDTVNYIMYIHSPEDYPSFVGSFYALRKAGIISHFMLHVSK